MWIRNKGTKANPRFALVETRRLRGEPHPKQKVICYIGQHDNFEDAIKFWGIVLRELNKVERKTMRWRKMLKEFPNPLLEKYVRRGGGADIQARLRKYKHCAVKLRHHLKIKESGKIRRNIVRTVSETPRSLKLKFQIEAVSKLINKIYRDGDDRLWNPSIKSGIKTLLKDVIDFHDSL